MTQQKMQITVKVRKPRMPPRRMARSFGEGWVKPADGTARVEVRGERERERCSAH